MQFTACSDREGRSPASFLDEAREELSRYRSVTVRGTLVTAISTPPKGSSLSAPTARPATLRRFCLRRASLTSFLNSRGSNLSTGFPCIIAFTATVSNMRGSQ